MSIIFKQRIYRKGFVFHFKRDENVLFSQSSEKQRGYMSQTQSL